MYDFYIISILLHEISIWYNRKIELNIWYRNLCLQLQRSDVSCSSWPGCTHCSRDFGHSSIQVFSRSFRFWGCCWATWSFSSLHRFSIGFRSGDQDLEMFLTEPLLSCPCCVFGVIVMLEDTSHDPSSMLLLREGGCWQNVSIHGPIHPALNTVQSSYLLCRKAPPKHDVSTPCFTVGDGVLGIVLILLLPPNTASEVYNQKVIFWSHLTTWPSPLPPLDHPDGLWQTSDGAWTCAGLSRGTLRALQDFNPWRCCVLLMVTVETVVPALFRSFQVLPCRSSLIPYLSQDNSYATRRDLAWSPSPREIDSPILNN